MLAPVIVGAGPAGLACAAVLVEAGLRPVVLDEAPRPGGQGTRRLARSMEPKAAQLFGKSEAEAIALRQAREDRILAACDWRPGALAWGIFDGKVEILQNGRHESLRYDQILIATGATDRIMAFPGWTLPGVFSQGGSQVALKHHASLIGDRIVLAGSSPLLYLAAVQYVRMGARQITLVDSTSAMQKIRAAPGMALSSPATLLEGVRLLRELRRAGIRMIEGASLVEAKGGDRLASVSIRHANGALETLDCDALAFGHGLRPETQLAELAGASFRFDPAHRNWFPVIDADGRAGPGLWLAGDNALIGGRDAAASSGQLAALSIIAARQGNAPPATRQARHLRRRVARLRQFQTHMTAAFRWPHEQAAAVPDSTVVCRCERITAGEIRNASKEAAGPVEVNRVKAVTRCGMGRCQGRFCGQTLQELVASAAGCTLEAAGRLRAQAPVQPIPIGSAENRQVTE